MEDLKYLYKGLTIRMKLERGDIDSLQDIGLKDSERGSDSKVKHHIHLEVEIFSFYSLRSLLASLLAIYTRLQHHIIFIFGI